MGSILASFAIGLAVVLIAEYFHKKQKIVTETTRKIIHMGHGLILIALSFITPWLVVILVEIGFFAVAVVARRYKWFKSQHAVDRKSWGEFFFIIGVIAIILLHVPHWVFVIAVLHLTFADAAAALVGKRYGRTNRYEIFGQQKSVAGSLAFFLVSVGLIGTAVIVAPNSIVTTTNLAIYLLPFIATIAENLGIFGSDNLWILLVVTLLLR